MRKITTLLLCLIIAGKLLAQDEPKPFQVKFYPTIQFGFFLNAEDVNNYIANDLSNYTTSFGTTDLIMNFNLGAGIGFRFANIVEIQPQVEYSLGPKVISGGANESYNFNKLSGGLMANFMLPVSYNRKHSILIGAGMFYNNITFEEFSGNSINPRFQIGFSLNNNKFNPQILLGVDLAKTKADKFESFELNYSSFRIGVNLNF